MLKYLNRERLIGSRAWGGSNEESDFDFIAFQSEEVEVYETLIRGSILFENNDYPKKVMRNYKSVKFNYRNKIINIIFYEDQYKNAIKLAMDNVLRISKQNDLSNKEVRHLVCEASIQREF